MLSESKTALSRVIDGTGRAVRTQSCPFDSEALKTLTAPCAAVHKLSWTSTRDVAARRSRVTPRREGTERRENR